MHIHRSILCGLAAASLAFASGGSGTSGGSSGSGHNPTPAGAAEVLVSSAVIPSGGTVQVRFTLTEPRPISSTGGHVSLGNFQANGISLWSANGEACGAGVIKDGVLYFSAIDPSGVLGTGAEYPYLTLSLTAPQGLAAGTKIPVSWDPGAWLTSPAGPLDFIVKPGSVTIGGSIYIDGVYPGGGTYPAGTLIRVLGAGFQPNIRIQTPVKYSSISVGPGEIDLYLKEQTTLDSQMFQVTNPDGSTATYFAYLKGTLIQQPSTDLLQNVELAFPLATHAIASVGTAGALSPGQWQGLALQNPNPGPVVVTLQLASQPPGSATSILLPSGGRIADSLTALLNGASIQPGDTVQLNSTSPIQIMGLNGDDQAQTLAPFVPSF